METEYGELQIGINRRYGDEVLVETTADASERGGATKVLSLESEVKLTGAELMEGEAEVTGKVNYRLLYLDRQEHLCGLDYYKDFKCRVKGEEIEPNGKCSVRFSVPDAEATLRGEEFTLSAMVKVEVAYFGEKSEKAVTTVSDAETLVKSIRSERVKRSERIVELEKVADSGPNVKKIVLFGAEAVPMRVTSQEGGKELAGEVRVAVLYLNEADEAVELTTAIPFAENFEEGAAEYAVTVKNARIVLTDDEGGGVIDLEVALSVEEIAYEETEREVTVAAIGAKSEITESVATVECSHYLGEAFYEEPLTGKIPYDQEGYVAFLRPGCRAIAEVAAEEGFVRAEGVAAFRGAVLKEGIYHPVQGELPFSYRLPFEGAAPGRVAEVKVAITDVKGTVGAGEIAVSAKASISVTLFEREICSYLVDATEGDPYPESEAGITVYFAEKGEDPWMIAKAMKVLPSALIEANPFLSEPLTEDQKVLIVRKK